MNDLVARLYRAHAPVLAARLTATFGVRNLDLVEAIVQDAFEAALRAWPERGIPSEPLAWLTTVARNACRDRLRSEARFARRIPELEVWFAQPGSEAAETLFEAELPDELLRMTVVACHPALPLESRVCLALRTLCGFSTVEIGRALLTSPQAVEKRLVRARTLLRQERVCFELPPPDALVARLDSVLAVLYVLFGEGYAAHSGDRAVRDELCHDAIRLARILARHPVTRAPRCSALLALFCLQASRLAARCDADDEVVDLERQDRSRWDLALVREGMASLAEASRGDALSAWHLQAGIAACHSLAPSFAETRWSEIVRLYDLLRVVDDSPVVALNRAIAVGYAQGPHAALALLSALDAEARFRDFALLHAARADALRRSGDPAGARDSLRRALAVAPTGWERRFLERRLVECGGSGPR